MVSDEQVELNFFSHQYHCEDFLRLGLHSTLELLMNKRILKVFQRFFEGSFSVLQ